MNKEVECAETIYFQYETSTIENAYNEPKLLEYFKKFSKKTFKLFCDEPGFISLLRELISKKINEKKDNRAIKVIFDISVCSSKLILSVIKTLLNVNIELTIAYTEAYKYFPQYSDYISDREVFKEKSIATDEKVVLNTDYSGGTKVNPDLVIAFPNFKAQRVKNMISEIDETILLKPEDRLIWIIGEPNMDIPDSENRKRMMLYLNDIEENSKIYEVSTLNYKKTIEKLEHLYQSNHLKYHINIADLGSKMQTLAIAIYCLIRPEISIYNTVPKIYGPSEYSQGVKDYWCIEFGNTKQVIEKINGVDLIFLS